MLAFHAIAAFIFPLAMHFGPSHAQGGAQAWCSTPEPDGIHNQTNVAGYFLCQTQATTYVDKGSPDSPLIEDCKQLVKNLEAGLIQMCTFDRCTTDEIPVSYKSCHISIEAIGGDKDCGMIKSYIGTGDIIEYINGAIERFSRPDGRVAASGVNVCWDYMECFCTHAQWTIYP